eukprot:6346049-Prorocentrum_lima.AAC.1
MPDTFSLLAYPLLSALHIALVSALFEATLFQTYPSFGQKMLVAAMNLPATRRVKASSTAG